MADVGPGLPYRYLAGSTLARFADEGFALVVTLLAVQRTGRASTAAVVLACWLAPHVLVAPVVGAYASTRRRATTFYAAALLGFTAAIAALVAMVGRAPLPAVLAAAVLGGSVGPVVSGGLSSLVAALVPEAARQRAYALDAAAYNGAGVAGPAAVAAVAAAFSAAAAGAVLVAAAFVSACLIGALPSVGARAAAAPRSLLAGVGTGLAAIWRERPLRAVTAATTVAYLGIGGLTVTAVLLAGQWGDPADGGLLVTGFAAGALAGALALARWPLPIRPERLAALSLLVTGLALAAAAAMPSLPGCLALFVLAGLGDGPLLTATLRIRATYAPETARAQVFTTGAALKLSAASLGAALVGLTATWPPSTPLLLIAATQLAGAGILIGHATNGRRRPSAPVPERTKTL